MAPLNRREFGLAALGIVAAAIVARPAKRICAEDIARIFNLPDNLVMPLSCSRDDIIELDRLLHHARHGHWK